MGSGDGFGRLGGKTVLYYTVTSLAAIVTGLVVVNLIVPGQQNGIPVKELLGLTEDVSTIVMNADGRGAGDFVTVF